MFLNMTRLIYICAALLICMQVAFLVSYFVDPGSADFAVLIRADKFILTESVGRWTVGIFVWILSASVLYHAAGLQVGFFTPTGVFALFFLFLVYPGVVFYSPDTDIGNAIGYSFCVSTILFVSGVVFISRSSAFDPSTECSKFRDDVRFIPKRLPIENGFGFLRIVVFVALVIVIFQLLVDGMEAIKAIASFLKEGIIPDEASSVRELRAERYSGAGR